MIQSPPYSIQNGPRMDPEQPRSIVFAAVGVVGSRRPLQLEMARGKAAPRRNKWPPPPSKEIQGETSGRRVAASVHRLLITEHDRPTETE